MLSNNWEIDNISEGKWRNFGEYFYSKNINIIRKFDYLLTNK